MKLLRYILWIIVAFIIAKMLRIVLGWRRTDHDSAEKVDIPQSAFENIQDAEFEDLTPKSPPKESPQE
ncbi:MAG: hypothetical protein HY033_08515 [Ignavibacteriae bacterium]|nr:hypothetical protein [Ignavibacteria bacterium]MBI3364935.1 hypothetical protein [Ignavibacteriota bacterium]